MTQRSDDSELRLADNKMRSNQISGQAACTRWYHYISSAHDLLTSHTSGHRHCENRQHWTTNRGL